MGNRVYRAERKCPWSVVDRALAGDLGPVHPPRPLLQAPRGSTGWTRAGRGRGTVGAADGKGNSSRIVRTVRNLASCLSCAR